MPATTLLNSKSTAAMKSTSHPQLPVASPDACASKEVKVLGKLSNFSYKDIEEVGLGYMHHMKRLVNSMTLSEDEETEIALEQDADASATNFDRDIYDDDVPVEVLKYDPLKWRQHDHYLIMGLGKVRINATDEHIKQAYRRRVLRHHPDKKAAESEEGANGVKQRKDNDSFFKCIQKSWEILTDPTKRRQFDSADPTFDETVPTFSSSKKKLTWDEYLNSFGKAFSDNARYSKVTPVPHIGDENSSKEDVDKFFDFWYGFDSWRTFEWYDEEEGGSSESRDDKRYLDKKNRAMRQKRKKEDNQRITRLVDSAIKYDPRLQKFKEQERELRDQKKREKQMAEEAKIQEVKREQEEKARQQEAAEAAAKQVQNEEKSRAKAVKEAIRKAKRNIRREMQTYQYYLSEDAAKPPSFNEIDERLALLEKMFSNVSELYEFEYIYAALSDLSKVQEKNSLFLELADSIASKASGAFLSIPEKYAYLKSRDLTPSSSRPSSASKLEIPSEPVSDAGVKSEGLGAKKSWTSAQQSQLEAALRKYPASNFKSKPQARWDKIAASVDGKSVMDVKHRVKELAEQSMTKTCGSKKK